MTLICQRQRPKRAPVSVAGTIGIVLAAVSPASANVPGDEPAALTSDECEDDGAECFALLGVTIDGASSLSPGELAATYEPYLGREVGAAQLVLIADQITRRYVDAGYFLSQAVVPPQDAGTGIARILVIEGRITNIEILGDGADQIEPYLSGLTEEPIADLKDIDRRLALASDVPGLKLRSAIEPVPDQPSHHRLIVETEMQAVEGQILVDNRGTDAIGPLQAYGRLSLNALLAERDQLTVSAYTTPEEPSELTQIAGAYRRVVGQGTELGASYMRSEADGGFNIETPNVGGNSEVGSFWYSLPLARSRRTSFWLDGSFEAGHFENEWLNGGGYEDETRVGRITLRGRHNVAGESTNVQIRISAGLDALGASGPSIFDRSRYDADGGFTKLDFRVSRYRDVGRYFGVYAALAGQVSADPLLLSEEFSAGGMRFGRAYSYGEISGDHGLGGTLEFRAGYDPGLEPISFLQGYAFYDIAQVWNENMPAAVEDLKLSSAGLGLRVDILDRLTARIETAKPLERTPFGADDRDWRQFFSISASY